MNRQRFRRSGGTEDDESVFASEEIELVTELLEPIVTDAGEYIEVG